MSMDKKMNIKKIGITAVVTIIWFLVVTFLYGAAFGETTRIKINGKVSKNIDMKIFYTATSIDSFTDKLSEVWKATPSSEFQTYYFEIHRKDVGHVKLQFENNPEEIQIKNVVFEQAFKKVTLSPEEVKSFFSGGEEGVDKSEIKDGVLHIYSTKEAPYIYSHSDYVVTILKNTGFDLVKLSIILICSFILSMLTIRLYKYLSDRRISKLGFSFIAIFLVIICLPGAVNIIGVYPGENMEQRELAQRPTLKLNKDTISYYPKAYEDYENDNFGMKNYLVKLNNYINVKLLGTSPMESVLLGKDGWLYYSKDSNINMIDDYRGLNLFSEDQLKKISDNLEEQKKWLDSKGIPFILVIAPNKESIYPEHLPDNIKKVQDKTKLDQLVSYLKQNSDVTVIDMRQKLISEKESGSLYYRTDSHWNQLGAYYAQEEIMKEVTKHFKNIKPKTLEDFTVTKGVGNEGGDLAKMLSLKKNFKEDIVVLNPKVQNKWTSVDKPPYPLEQGVVTENQDKSLPRLLMFRDSFTLNLQPYLSDYFSTAVYQWNHNFNPELVEMAKPDIVIHEVVERYIPELLTENSSSIRK